MTDDRDTSDIRSPAARAVIAAVVSTAVLVGAAFLVINRLHSSAANVVEHPGPAATDAQTQSEVVEQAKDIVAIAALQQPTAGYLLMSCKDHDNPPYQGAVYLDFQLPPDVSADQYFRTIAAAMVGARLARGFTAQPAHVRQKSVEGRRQRDPLSGSRLARRAASAVSTASVTT